QADPPPSPAVPVHARRAARFERARRLQHVREQRPAREPVQHLGGIRAHALAESGGKHDHLERDRAILARRYLGSSEKPIRNSSTARAHWRPSRIAHTTSDWPRRVSPAAKTFGTE